MKHLVLFLVLLATTPCLRAEAVVSNIRAAQIPGNSLGAPASQVLTMLQAQGSSKPVAKRGSFLPHPLHMTTTDLLGVIIGFDAAKKLFLSKSPIPTASPPPASAFLINTCSTLSTPFPLKSIS